MRGLIATFGALALAMFALRVDRDLSVRPTDAPLIRAPDSSALPIATGKETDAPIPVLRVHSADYHVALNESVERAMDLLQRGDIVNARFEYQNALQIVRDKPEDLEALLPWIQHFRESLLAEERLSPIRTAFADDDFRTALALLYRLPAELEGRRTESLKGAAWYNLAIVALRAGNCDDAAFDIAEAAGQSPDLRGLQSLRALAATCSSMTNDRRYSQIADRIPFVGFPAPA